MFLLNKWNTVLASFIFAEKWACQLRLSLTSTPRSFITFVELRETPCRNNLESWPLKVNLKHFSFAEIILFSFAQPSTASRLDCTFSLFFVMDKIFIASAKRCGSLNFKAAGRSFMKMQNLTGPTKDPWGTPLVTSRACIIHKNKLLALIKVIRFYLKNAVPNAD